MGRVRFLDEDNRIIGMVSSSAIGAIETVEDTPGISIEWEAVLSCDICEREYHEWREDDPFREPPMNICGESDCE
jgi:hypothetical protein